MSCLVHPNSVNLIRLDCALGKVDLSWSLLFTNLMSLSSFSYPFICIGILCLSGVAVGSRALTM